MGKIKTRFISIADLEVKKGKRCLEHGTPEDLVIDLIHSCWKSQIHVSLSTCKCKGKKFPCIRLVQFCIIFNFEVEFKQIDHSKNAE